DLLYRLAVQADAKRTSLKQSRPRGYGPGERPAVRCSADIKEALAVPSPGSVREAVDLLASHDGNAHVLAGGTDLLVKLRAGFVSPQLVVDVKAIAQLRGISTDARGFRIGAAVSW